jgi:hypothetical protein
VSKAGLDPSVKRWYPLPTSIPSRLHCQKLSGYELEIPAENLIGEEGKGFKYILDG